MFGQLGLRKAESAQLSTKASQAQAQYSLRPLEKATPCR
jgi:hypothetical protein